MGANQIHDLKLRSIIQIEKTSRHLTQRGSDVFNNITNEFLYDWRCSTLQKMSVASVELAHIARQSETL